MEFMLDQASASTRQDVVSQIAQQLGAVVSKRVGMAVGLWGDPGIGKTHTVHTIFERVPCRHISLHATTSISQIAAALPKARTLPAWGQAQIARLERDEPVEKSAVVATLAAALGALAPFVLHLEDLHEAKAERLELITALARAVTRTRGVGLLVTSRTALPEPFRNHRLEPLRLAETAALLEHELKSKVPQDGLEWIFGRTQGNPLFTLEFLRYLIRQGFLWSDGQSWRWRAPGDDFMPVTVEALIEQLRLNLAVSPEVQATLEARTMLPSELELPSLYGVWADVADLNLETLEQIRADLERGGLMRGAYFAHPLFAEVIASGVPSSRRRVFAGRAYTSLEVSHPMLAVRFLNDAGLEADQAIRVIDRAIVQAQTVGQGVQANRLLRLSLVWRHGRDRAEVALEAARGLYETNYHEVQTLIEIALEADPDNIEAIYFLIEWRLTARQGDAALDLLNRLPEAERASARCWAKRIKYGFLLEAWQQVKQLWYEHPEFQATAPAMAVHDVAFAHHFTGDQLAALALVQGRLERTDLQPLERCDLWNIQACALGVLDRDAEAIHVFSNAIDLATQLDAKLWVSTYYYNRAFSLERLARLEEAIRDAETCVQLRVRHGSPAQIARVQPFLGLLLVRHGEFERAEVLLLETMSLQGSETPNRAHVECRIALCELYLAWQPAHGPTLARRYATSALEIARGRGEIELLLEALETCISVELQGANPLNAVPLLAEFSALINPDLESHWSARVHFAHGQAHFAYGQHDEARMRFERAIGLAEASGPIWQPHRFGIELDRMTNNLERARSRLAWFEAHGLHWLSLHLRKCFPELGIHAVAVSEELHARLCILGPIKLERDGKTIPSRARKRLEILTYLLETRIAGRTEASALELVDALYPDLPEPEAKKALKQLVYLNRSGLGADSVISTPTGYALGAVSSDAEDFLQTGDSTLWRGAYLGDLTEGWHQGVRDAMTLALQTKAESLLESDPNEAARLGLILTEMEPLDAQTLRLTVQSLERSGNIQAARATYREGRSRLLEMGEVLPETVDGFLRL
jgi:tetratricopeptide (TPR) repeat protein